MINSYQDVFKRLNIQRAVYDTKRNDLLTPRPEDRVRGELGNRYLEHLCRDISRGEFDPTPSYTVSVSKSLITTRPASLLSFSDRVMYEAIIATLRPRIEDFLLGNDIVYWPRGTAGEKRWRDFEMSATQLPDCKYVVRADIVGFYESIEHDSVGQKVVAATGYRDVADALVEFLNRVMQSHRGLPQGLIPSDPIATLYLSDVDFSMVQENFQYARHGDDIRIAVPSFRDGRRALRTLEAALRKEGLLLNVEKTRLLRFATYRSQLAEYDKILKKTKERITKARIERLRDDNEALLHAIDDAGQDQLAWDLFFHGTADFDDVIRELRPHIEPGDVDIAEKLFREAVDRRPGTENELSREVFHQQITHSLIRMAAGRSVRGVYEAGNLIRRFPEKIETVCSYLMALSSVRGAAGDIVSQMEQALATQESESDLAWVICVLDRFRSALSNWVIEHLQGVVLSPHGRWLMSVEAAKLLGAIGKLDHQVFLRMWNTCPQVLRSDLVEAGARMAKVAPWARAFVAGLKSDPIHVVVARHESQRP